MLRSFAVLFFCAALAPLPAADHWIRISTPHFELLTTNSEKQGVAALKVFEQVRYFFLQNSHSKSVPDLPVRIIAFRSEKEFSPYRLNEGSFAYYLRSRKMDYIVMQDISSEHYQAAVHEYTHLIVEHLDLKLPLWFDEGLAEVYSSLEADGNRAIVGRVLPGRIFTLTRQPWVDLNLLFAVDRNSPYYNVKDKMDIFYAESWALSHMLMFGKDYSAAFNKFMAAVASGQSSAAALQAVYGKSLEQVDKDLHAYLKQSTVRAAVFDVKLSKADLEPEASEPTPFSIDLALADLLAAQQRTTAEAATRLARLAASHPESPEVQESLGYLDVIRGDEPKAREHFKLASEKGSTNPEMFYYYAMLLQNSGAPAGQILPVLRDAVRLKPNYDDAWFALGILAANDGRAGEAISALAHFKTVTPDRAYSFFSTQAYCYLQLKAADPARASAEKAKQYATTAAQNLLMDDYLNQVDRMLHPRAASAVAAAVAPDVEGPARPTLERTPTREVAHDVPRVEFHHIQSVMKTLDCTGDTRRLHVMVNGKELTFDFDQPDAVKIRNLSTQNGSIEMTCGPQKPTNVTIVYLPAAPPSHSEGLIRELLF